MSLYTPDPKTLKVVRHDGESGPFYFVHDQHGEYDGPYASWSDAASVIQMHFDWAPGGPLNAHSRRR